MNKHSTRYEIFVRKLRPKPLMLIDPANVSFFITDVLAASRFHIVATFSPSP